MAKQTRNPVLDAVDLRHLRYFAVVAEERNLSRAALRLHMAQPPLSRQMALLEERLGVRLFDRHNKGLTLTLEGERVLALITPLLRMRDRVFDRLQREIRTGAGDVRIGFTTAFEQGVYGQLEQALMDRHRGRVRISRAPSPRLVTLLRKGGLDAALVALPLDAAGLRTQDTGYEEAMVAAMPASWPESDAEKLFLRKLAGKPLFWFARQRNPAFFDWAARAFALAEFAPLYLEEPAEHDVLLAQVASGRGMSLMPQSFTVQTRPGVCFVPLADTHLRMRMGVAEGRDGTGFAEEVARWLPAKGGAGQPDKAGIDRGLG